MRKRIIVACSIGNAVNWLVSVLIGGALGGAIGGALGGLLSGLIIVISLGTLGVKHKVALTIFWVVAFLGGGILSQVFGDAAGKSIAFHILGSVVASGFIGLICGCGIAIVLARTLIAPNEFVKTLFKSTTGFALGGLIGEIFTFALIAVTTTLLVIYTNVKPDELRNIAGFWIVIGGATSGGIGGAFVSVLIAEHLARPENGPT